MYVYLYLYACKMYIYGYRAACLACMCTCESCESSESCESCLSLSLSRAGALTLSRPLSLKRFCIVVLLSALSSAYMQALGYISWCYKCLQKFVCRYAAYKEYQIWTTTQNSLSLSLFLSLSKKKDPLFYTSASEREASQGHAATVEFMTPTDYDT